MKRVLITGAGSFTARHLMPVLASQGGGPEIFTTDARPGVPGARGEVRGSAGAPAAAAFRAADLADRAAVRAVVEWARPDTVFHLAGVSAPDPDTCFAVNLDGTRHLLEACAALDPSPTVLVVSSAAVYGLTAPGESPVTESTPFRPLTAYGASKAAAEIFALTLHRRGGLRVAVARPFNLIGPGLRPGLAPSDFMAQALAIRAGHAPPELHVGNLEPRRDFVDVRDAARAYIAIVRAEACLGAPWNVATGRPVAIGDLLAGILRASGIEARIIVDSARMRQVEVLEQVGDTAALRAATGWSASVTLEESLRDMVSGS